MWKLTSKSTGENYYLLLEKEKYVVGRLSADSDMILNNDISISRCHANLYPSENYVKLVDIGSKYGTFYNENIDHSIRIEKNVEIQLKNGERVRFGILNNEWILSKTYLTTLISTLSLADKMLLNNTFNSLNVKIVESFVSNCTHLTMPKVTITLKLLYALVERIPIVNVQFWQDYLIELRKGNSPPSFVNYLPDVAEDFLSFDKNLFKPTEARKTLFAGKTFIFSSKKLYDTYTIIISKAGGQTKSLNDGVTKSLLTQKNVIVVKRVASSQSQSLQILEEIAEFLKKKSLRMIPEYEIGLALINCSVQKYCNPNFDVLHHLCDRMNNLKATPESPAYATDTPINETDKYTDNLISEIVSETESNKMESEAVLKSNNNDIESNQNNSTDFSEFSEKYLNNFEIEDPANNLIENEDVFAKENKRKRNITSTSENTFKKPCYEKVSKDTQLKINGTKNTQEFEDYLNCSQIVNEEVSKQQSQQLENERKRSRISSNLTDDEDLFGFNAKKSKEDISITNSVHNNKQLKDSGNIDKNADKSPLNSTSLTTTKSSLVMRTLPKSSSNGWLSTHLIKLEIKCEDDEKLNIEKLNWINSIRNGFEVRSKSMNLISRTLHNNSLDRNCLDGNDTNYKGKNFKTFVKKRNFPSQKSVIQTKPFQVQGFSF